MTDEECEKAIAEFDKTKAPYIDARLRDGTRVVTQHLALAGGGGGGGSSSCKGADIHPHQKIEVIIIGDGGWGNDNAKK